MPNPTLNLIRRLAVWGAVLFAVTAGVWLAGGPFFLSRSVEFTLAAKNAGPNWSLEWQDDTGAPINGMWLDVPVDAAGNAHIEVLQQVPNYKFDRLALRWWWG